MSSTNKYPSGLSNWLDSDKPERSDFVTDNEIIDQNALWKDDYDAEGFVAQSGGIDAYVMAKSNYDPAGVVAAAGGITNAIQSAVSANEGYSTYTHSKNGTVHSLTNANGGSVIRFVASGNYNAGDIFTINGTAHTARTCDGEDMEDGFFAAGSVVSCFLNGTSLNFKNGGANLNFKVVVVASDQLIPVSAAENTIVVISNLPLPAETKKYGFYPVEVASPLPAGYVWIQTASGNGDNQFNAVKGGSLVSIWPTRVSQWDGTKFVKKDAHIFKNSIWTKFSSARYYIYNAENPAFVDYTGNYRIAGTSESLGIQYVYGSPSNPNNGAWDNGNVRAGGGVSIININILNRSSTIGGNTGQIDINGTVDVTGYTKLVVVSQNSINNYQYNGPPRAYISSACATYKNDPNAPSNALAFVALPKTNTVSTTSLDITGFTGNMYFGIKQNVGTNSIGTQAITYLNITSLYLE